MHKICIVTLNDDNRFENRVEITPCLSQENKWLAKILDDGIVSKKLIFSENPVLDEESAEEFLDELCEDNFIEAGWYRVHVPEKFRGDCKIFEGWIG